jgi:hypothetical protein
VEVVAERKEQLHLDAQDIILLMAAEVLVALLLPT